MKHEYVPCAMHALGHLVKTKYEICRKQVLISIMLDTVMVSLKLFVQQSSKGRAIDCCMCHKNDYVK